MCAFLNMTTCQVNEYSQLTEWSQRFHEFRVLRKIDVDLNVFILLRGIDRHLHMIVPSPVIKTDLLHGDHGVLSKITLQ